MEKQHLDIIIKGNIQNIGFTFQVLKIADKLGVKGFVAYTGQSTAKIEVESEASIVSKFIDMCKTGIPEAGKLEIETTPSKYRAFETFTINEFNY